MTYSDLYRCSGCSVTFADPVAWREAAAQTAPAATERPRGAGIGPSDHTGPVPELMSSWGSMPTQTPDASTYGYNEVDTRAIKGAAARANKAKGRGW
jgi:hypothetical protein